MKEENSREQEKLETKKEPEVNKGKEFADSLIAGAEKSQKDWDGKSLYKILKFLIVLSASIVIVLELFFFIWPKVKHNFPENIPVADKCEKAKCPKSCYGECSCKYINIYEREETVTCIVK